MRIIKILICLFFIMDASAQNYIDIGRLDIDLTKPQAFDTTGFTKGKFFESTIDFTVPIKVNESVAILTGINLESLVLDISPSRTNQTFYSLLLKTGVNIKHSKKWSATYLLLPKLASGLRANQTLLSGIGSDIVHAKAQNFQLGGVMLFKYHKNPTTSYKIGGYYNSELFGPLFIPFIGVYKLNGKLETNITLPLMADVRYQLSEKLYAGLKFQGSNKSYNIDDLNEYMVKLNNEVGPYVHYSIGSFLFQIQAGMSFLRRFRTYQEDERVKFALSIIKMGDNRIQTNSDRENGLFLKTSLIYRFDLPDNN